MVERWVLGGAFALAFACAIESQLPLDEPLRTGLRDVVRTLVFAAAAAVLARRAALDRDARIGWGCLAGAVVAFALGSLVYRIAVDPRHPLEAPVGSTVLYLLCYVLAYTGVTSLVRRSVPGLARSLLLDGAVAALTLATVVAAVVAPTFHAHGFSGTEMAGALVHPATDLVLLAVSLAVLSLTSWRANRAWLAIAAGFAVLAVADVIMMAGVASRHLVIGGVPAAAYPIGMLLLALASTQELGAARRLRADGIRPLALPAVCIVAVLVTFGLSARAGVGGGTLLLGMLALAFSLLRLATTVAELRDVYEARRFERGFEEASVGMALLDSEHRWVKVNDALCAMLGRSREELLGRTALEMTHPDDLARSVDFARAAARDGERGALEKRYMRPDGTAVEALTTTTLVDGPEPGTRLFFSQLQDITDRRRAERKNAAIAQLARGALASGGDRELMATAATVVRDTLDVAVCSVIALESADMRTLRLVGTTTPVWEPDTVFSFSHSLQTAYTLTHDQPVIANDLSTETRFAVHPELIERGMARSISVPIRQRMRATHVITAQVAAASRPFDADDAGFLEGVAGLLSSALDRSAAETELRRRALHDPLTGLANRVFLTEQLDHLLARRRDSDAAVGAIILDLDGFKRINDTFGHAAGDDLLMAAADRLRAATRDEDLVARLGGDEFVVCAEAGSETALAELAQRLVGAFAKPITGAGHELFLPASVGLAVSRDGDGASSETLLRDGDVAMYRAKETGGNRYEIFDAELRASFMARLSAEADLRGALEREELELHYQPIVDLQTGGFAAFEALMRWRHPERGLVPPCEFIPIAEESQLIVPMGRWLIRRACEQLALWNAGRPDARPARVSINISAVQVGPQLIETVEDALAATGIDPVQLTLELTESVLIEVGDATEVLAELRERGVTVAIDDFGTGYSSLGYLERFPHDYLKLDRAFVAQLGEESARSEKIVRAIVQMARALGPKTTAEGIEQPEQLATVRALGFDFGQGFLFGRPAPAAEVEWLLDAPAPWAGLLAAQAATA